MTTTPKTRLRITIIASVVGLVIPVWLLLYIFRGLEPVPDLFSGYVFKYRAVVTGYELAQSSLHKEFFIFLVSMVVICPFIALVRWINGNSPRIVRMICVGSIRMGL